MLQRFALALSVLLTCFLVGFTQPARQQAPTVYPSPLTEPFDIWVNFTHGEKTIFYSGWANGYFANSKDAGTSTLGSCLEKLTFEQIVATVDQWSADHHERFQNPIGTEIIQAVTASGSPCEGIEVGSPQK